MPELCNFSLSACYFSVPRDAVCSGATQRNSGITARPPLTRPQVRRMLLSPKRTAAGPREDLNAKREDFSPLPPPPLPRPPPSLALFYWSFLEALVFPQLIPTWIRDDKQPVNGGLNQEMELPLPADRGRPRLITPLFRLWARPPRGGAVAFSYSSLIELIEPG